MEAQDLITALTNQRNAALNEAAQLFAMLESANREIIKSGIEIAALKEQIKAPQSD